MIKNIRFVF